jgi:hypothetical protein
LLEVLFSIGVALIGLLGVAALLPLAVHYMGRGSVADNAAIFGRSAVSAFKARQMLRPTMWAASNLDPNIVGIPPSFCIDPLYISRSGNTGPSLFPAVRVYSPEEPRMARVTLRIAPGGPPLPAIVAEEWFMLTDQHVYKRQPDRTSLPEPFISSGKRQYDPNLSWFATLTPIVSPAGGFNDSDLYLLSIVVVESRDLRTDITLNENRNDRPIERVVDVLFPTGDWAGGSVVLVTRPNRPESDVEVRPGDWLMLGGRLKKAGSPAVFRWYRVLSADRDSTGPSREVVLHGTDWDPNAVLKTQATILNGVTAVFEKIVRIETSSL